jgi:hypothetical protein
MTGEQEILLSLSSSELAPVDESKFPEMINATFKTVTASTFVAKSFSLRVTFKKSSEFSNVQFSKR